MTASMMDGHTEITTVVEPDGRIRVTVFVHGECVAAPTFKSTDYAAAVFQVLTEIADLPNHKGDGR